MSDAARLVDLIKRGEMAVITIQNPARNNELSSAVLMQLNDVLNRVKNDDEVKTVVITGQGLFSVGASVEEIWQISSEGNTEKARELLTKANDIVNAIQDLGKPTIAAIERFCLGGGNEIAMACNYRIATEDTRLGQPEIKLGIIPGMGGTQRLPRLINLRKALSLLVSGEMIDAKQAKDLGLIDEVVPKGTLLAVGVKKWIAENTKDGWTLNAQRGYWREVPESEIDDALKTAPLNDSRPEARDIILDAVSQGLRLPRLEALKLEQDLFARLVVTEKAQEYLAKFLKKPLPKKASVADPASKTENANDKAETLKMIRDTVRSFLVREVRPNVEKMEAERRIPRELLKRMAVELEMFGIPFPEEYGGVGLGKVGYCILMEEIARVHGSLAAVVGAHMGLGCMPIYLFGTAEQKGKYLKAGIEGDMIGAFALTEPNAGSDAFNLSTMAVKAEDGSWTLNGRKQFITNGDIADFMIVFAQTDKESGRNGITAFIMDTALAGFKVERVEEKIGIHASRTANVTFDDVRIPPENVLGRVGQGYKVAMIALNGGRLSLAAGCLGATKEALKLAYNHAVQTKRSGQSILEFQIIQVYLAKIRATIYLMEAGIYKAAEKADQGADIREEAAILKWMCSEMGGQAIDAAVQVFGGYGYMIDYPIARMYCDARINRIFEGTNEIQSLMVCKELVKNNGLTEPLV